MLKAKLNDVAVRTLNNSMFDLGLLGVGKFKQGMLFGVELECEGAGVAMEGVASKNWRRVEDGSLRGESIEYVFAAPCDYNEAVARVHKLFSMFDKNKVKLKDSYRTSTHVHLNFSDKTGKQIVNFFILYTIVEELLEYYCGELRKGNLFCLSCRDNEELVQLLNDAIFLYGNYREFNNEVRYNAANLAALNKYGTIELRTMRGCNKEEELLEWLEIVNLMYEFACSDRCPPPWKLVEALSHLGPNGFLLQMFPQRIVDTLLNKWPVVRDFRRSLLDGVRLVQMLAYKLEEPWTKEYKKIEMPKPEIKHAKRPFAGERDDPLNNANNNMIDKDGENWFVSLGYRDGRKLEDDFAYIWSEDDYCFKHVVTGHRCPWKMHRGSRDPVMLADLNWWIDPMEDRGWDDE